MMLFSFYVKSSPLLYTSFSFFKILIPDHPSCAFFGRPRFNCHGWLALGGIFADLPLTFIAIQEDITMMIIPKLLFTNPSHPKL